MNNTEAEAEAVLDVAPITTDALSLSQNSEIHRRLFGENR